MIVHNGGAEQLTKTEEATAEESSEEEEEPTVLVGKKPVSRYLASCLTIVNSKHDKLWVEGMGQAISKVVDIVNFFMRFHDEGQVQISDFEVDMVPREVVHGLPKHVSRLRIQLSVNR
jgi:DNA-binding protein Alba